MAVTLSNYTELRDKGRIKEVALSLADGTTPRETSRACRGCHVEIQETITGCRSIGSKLYCSDCYFDKIGDWLDSHPIGVSRAQR